MEEKTGFITFDTLTQSEKSLKSISLQLTEMAKNLKKIRDMQQPNYKILVNLGDPEPDSKLFKEVELALKRERGRNKELEEELSRILRVRTDALMNCKAAFSHGYAAGSRKNNFESAWLAYLRSCVHR